MLALLFIEPMHSLEAGLHTDGGGKGRSDPDLGVAILNSEVSKSAFPIPGLATGV